MFALRAEDWQAIYLSLQLAAISTLILLLITIPLAWFLAFSANRFRAVVATLVSLPLILPPSVLGFYLLVALGPHGPIGKLCQLLGLKLLPFSFNGLVLASVIYSLPFVVQPIQATFNGIGKRPFEIAAMLGATPKDAFFNAFLPQAKAGIISAAILGFAHTLGEFGVVLMIGGNIPNATQVVSIQIYNHVEAFEYQQANALALILLLFSCVVLFVMYRINHKFNYLSVN